MSSGIELPQTLPHQQHRHLEQHSNTSPVTQRKSVYHHVSASSTLSHNNTEDAVLPAIKAQKIATTAPVNAPDVSVATSEIQGYTDRGMRHDPNTTTAPMETVTTAPAASITPEDVLDDAMVSIALENTEIQQNHDQDRSHKRSRQEQDDVLVYSDGSPLKQGDSSNGPTSIGHNNCSSHINFAQIPPDQMVADEEAIREYHHQFKKAKMIAAALEASDDDREDTLTTTTTATAHAAVLYPSSPSVSPPPPPATIGLTKDLMTAFPQPKKVNNEQWDAMFARLVQYKEKHGDCLVPKRYVDDQKLGTWVETQRVQYKRLPRTVCEHSGNELIHTNKRLNADRLAKLESIGFAWSAKNMRKPKAASSNCSPLGVSATTSGVSCNTFSNGGKSKRSATSSVDTSQGCFEGQPALAAAILTMPHSAAVSRAAAKQRLNDAQWEDMYQRLKEYKARFGDCLVPRRYELDPKLANWVETQRVLRNRDYRKAATASTPSVRQAMEQSSSETGRTAGTVTTGAAVSMNGRSEDLLTSQAAKLHDPVAASPSPTSLLGEQRSSSVNWDTASVDPARGAGEVASTMQVDQPDVGHSGQQRLQGCAVPEASRDEKLWLLQQQQAPVKRLTLERKKKLDDLGFVWSLRSKRIEDHWDQMFRQLLEYKSKHGDCLVPSRYEENLKLGKWVETQRYEYTKLQRAAENAETQGERSESPTVATGAQTTPTATALPTRVQPSAPGVVKAGATRPTNPRLTEDRLRRLEEIGFEWKVKHKMKRYYDKQWDHMFTQLLEFKSATGHCMVPKRYPPNMKLGTWVHTQRIQYRKLMAGAKKGPCDTGPTAVAPTEEEIKEMKTNMKGEEEVSYRLTEARRKRLEDAGFIWSAREGEKGSETGRITRNSYDDQWDIMFEKLKEYKATHGDCLVPKRCKENPKLGTWVDTQRVQFKKLKKKLASQGRNYEGPTLNIRAKEEDETAAPAISPKPLVGRLTDDRIRRLYDLGFVWSLRDDWQKHYEELKEYKNVHGHCNVPARHAENRRLGIWVSAQRQQYKIMNQTPDHSRPRRSAPLTQERINLLNDIGFTWTIRSRDSLGESWNQRLEELKEFKAKHGQCLVPSRYPPNPELGIWVGTQRTQYRLYMKAKETGQTLTGAAAMNEERINELEELGFVWALRGGENKRDFDETNSMSSEEMAPPVIAYESTTTISEVATDEFRMRKTPVARVTVASNAITGNDNHGPTQESDKAETIDAACFSPDATKHAPEGVESDVTRTLATSERGIEGADGGTMTEAPFFQHPNHEPEEPTEI